MVSTFLNNYIFAYPFSIVSTSWWKKYPNKYSSNLKSIDVYDQKIINGELITFRILNYSLPIGNIYIVEKSIVNPITKEMNIVSNNISCNYINIVEHCKYKDYNNTTLYSQNININIPFYEKLYLKCLSEVSNRGISVVENICKREN